MLTKTKNVDPNSITTMPRFTETIQISIEVDSIYQKMLDLLPGDYKHREILAHAIVGSAAENGALVYIFNGLNGYTNEIDFEAGKLVECSEMERSEWYDANVEDKNGKPIDVVAVTGEHYKPKWSRRAVAIGKCKILEINLYKAYKLKIQFETADGYNAYPAMRTQELWVNHKKCQFLPELEIVS